MSTDTLRKVLAGVMIARAGYAAMLFLVVVLFRFDLANPANIDGNFARLLHGLTPTLIVIWALYVSGFMLAGIFTARSSHLALWVFGAAMVLDMSLWIFVSIQPNYESSWAGSAAAVDMFFNLLDISILVYLGALTLKRVLR